MTQERILGRNMRSKCRCSCVLQFTLDHAACCVLHRPTSQVIHRSGLFMICINIPKVCSAQFSKLIFLTTSGPRLPPDRSRQLRSHTQKPGRARRLGAIIQKPFPEAQGRISGCPKLPIPRNGKTYRLKTAVVWPVSRITTSQLWD